MLIQGGGFAPLSHLFVREQKCRPICRKISLLKMQISKSSKNGNCGQPTYVLGQVGKSVQEAETERLRRKKAMFMRNLGV